MHTQCISVLPVEREKNGLGGVQVLGLLFVFRRFLGFWTGIKPKAMDMSVKKAELKLAAHIACHSSIQTVDHLGELVSAVKTL